ncbi:MAG: PAS domain S-box protein [Methylovulum sp.]|nr:PAS domain S-box protein [Methylovulum sp.]
MTAVVNKRISRFVGRIPLAVAAIAVGVLALLGWMFDVALLKTALPGLPPIKLNTAVSLVLAGLSLWAACCLPSCRFYQRVAQLCAGGILLIALMTIGEYLTGMDFGIDQLFAKDIVNFLGDIPGRMPWRVAVCLVMLALALWLLVWDSRFFAKAIQTQAFVVALTAISGLVGYAYDIAGMHQMRQAFSPMSLNAAVALALLGLGIACAREEFLFRQIITSDSVAGKGVRQLFPAAIGLPFVTGWLVVQGSRAGYFSESIGVALFAVINMGGLGVVALWNANMLIRIDGQRKQAEDKLLSTSRYSRSLIEASLDPLVTISREGKITDVNEATVRATGVVREELVGRDFSDFFTEPDRAREGYHSVFAKGSVKDYPLTLRHLSGTLTEVLYNASVYRNEQGDVAGVFAAARDISELKRTEAKNRYLAAIVESSDDAIIGKTLEGIITSWNQGAERMYGYTADEAMGQPMSLLVPPRHQDDLQRIMDALKGGKHVEHFETLRRKKDGTEFYVSLSISSISGTGGGIIGAATVARDITKLKLLEKEREQYFKFFRLSMDPMCIADPYGCFRQVNPAFVLLTHFEESELVSRPFLDFVLPEDRQGTLDEMKLQVSTRPSMNFENRYVCKDGQVVFLSWTAYFDNSDGVTYATARNITERKCAEAQLRKYNEHLEELVRERTGKLETANQDLEGFAYSVSHDLRVPLRAIDGFSRILLTRYENQLDDEGKRYLNVVRDNTKKMGQLIDDILAFSRMGRLGMSVSETDMESLVREVFEELTPCFAGRGLTLDIKPLPPCQGDPAMLRQVWVNLLSNAIKFTRPKALALIEVGGRTEGAETLFYIKDNGAGFDMQYAEKLFGVFQRLHGVEEFEWTGIGLAIFKRIITRHGGRVWAEGKVDEGATFYISLPN